MEKIKSEEKRLLNLRDAKEQVDFHRATYVLIGGSILAAVLLVIANFFAGKEMARRRLAEAKQRDLIEELQKTLAEIKTLSGLIPICAWCKNIRSDEGFWQSVEHYVACHTDANFTHGMCPACIEKWHSDSKLEGPGN